MTADRIAKLLEDIRLVNEEHFKLVQALRKLILGFGDAVAEEVKYGGLLFSVSKPFCGVFSYANHVSLEFSAGAALPDKHKVLEGDGKLRRHIKLATTQDIERKHVRDYIALALKAAKTA
ncbi:MAG: DUF1801 domain-containing protein [Sideroxydans sp.]|nr:DUF1801 domain-containing protein [Sideroxydans sp.]